MEDCLEPSLVKGKIVLCRKYNGIDAAYRAGATGSIAGLKASGELLSDVSFVVSLAASSLKEHDFQLVESYYNSTK